MTAKIKAMIAAGLLILAAVYLGPGREDPADVTTVVAGSDPEAIVEETLEAALEPEGRSHLATIAPPEASRQVVDPGSEELNRLLPHPDERPRLSGGGRIHGVVSCSGRDVVDWRVEVVGPAPKWAMGRQVDQSRSHYASTDISGSFLVADLLAGEYVVGISEPSLVVSGALSHGSFLAERVSVRDGETTEVNLTGVLGRAFVRIRDAQTGASIPRASIQVAVRAGDADPLRATIVWKAIASDAGVVDLWLPIGEIGVIAWADGYFCALEFLDVSATTAAEAIIHCEPKEPGVRVSGRVDSSCLEYMDKLSVAMLMVCLTSVKDPGRQYMSLPMIMGEDFMIEDVPVGEYVMHCSPALPGQERIRLLVGPDGVSDLVYCPSVRVDSLCGLAGDLSVALMESVAESVDAGDADMHKIRLMIAPVEFPENVAYVAVGDDGHFEDVDRFVPGTYNARLVIGVLQTKEMVCDPVRLQPGANRVVVTAPRPEDDDG